MKIRASLTTQDYIKAQYVHLRPRPLIKWCGVSLIGLALWVCFVQLFFPPHGRITWRSFVMIGLLALLVILFWVVLPRTAKTIFGQQKSLQVVREIEITPEGCTSSSAFGVVTMKWKDFHKYKVGRDLILVYHSDPLFQMFPKRWFSADEYTQFQEYLRANLGAPKT